MRAEELRPAWLDQVEQLMSLDAATGSTTGIHLASTVDSLRDLAWRANHDPLTLLANRSWFIQSVEASRQAPENAGHTHVLMLLDLDRFKAINDSHGHATGDAVLAEIAHRLRVCGRPGDVTGRLGGDEFAIWVERVTHGTAQDLARRYLRVFDAPIVVNDTTIPTSGSIGLAATDGSQPIDDLLELADSALYAAKAQGPGSLRLFDQSLREHIDETAHRERAVADALRNDEYEFDLQPIIDLKTGKPIGHEVLSRWASPTHGRRPPSDFLPYLRSANLMIAFDTMVLDKAVRSLRRWRYGLRPPGAIWINLSPSHLSEALPDLVSNVISRHNVSDGELVFELTEHATANTPGRIAVLSRLRALGVRIAIDDFGTGYSQLAYLQQLPIDFVKLDRSFISNFHESQRQRAITKSIIDLAQALGAQVVGEGIETDGELECLVELGCDLGQGYLLGRPDTPARMLDL